MFTLEFKFSSLLNLSENNGILATNSNGKTREIKIKIRKSVNSGKS